MAIKAKLKTVQGVNLQAGYINLTLPQISKSVKDSVNVYSISANASVFVDEVSFSAGFPAVEGFGVVAENVDIESNLLKQLYAELKKNPKLSEITDC